MEPAGTVRGRWWRGRGRHVVSSLLVLAIISFVIFSRAQLVESSFEEPLSPTWRGPEGGGSAGGQGSGSIVRLGESDFVRSGQRSIRLVVWDDGTPEAMAWAGVMQVLPCRPCRKVRVGAWLYFSDSVLPASPTTVAQLKIEYFEDAQATRLVPTHLFLSPPFCAATYKPNTWHLIEAMDRAPAHAASLKFSIVVTGQGLNGRQQAIWLDDMFVEVQPARATDGLSRADAGTAASL
jgi:hypothetical protein